MSQARVLVAAAVAAGVLYLVGFIAIGSAPGASDHPLTIALWFRDHSSDARLYAWTATFGTLAFAVAAVLIRGTLPAPVRDVFLLGAAAFIVETAVQAWFWGGLALHPASLQPSVLRLSLDIASFWGPILTGATTTMIGAVTVPGIQGRSLIPRWLTALGIVAFLEQGLETATVFGRGGFATPGGAWNVALGASLTALWLAGLVVWAAQRLAVQSARAHPGPPT
jgi:hypothetical protein